MRDTNVNPNQLVGLDFLSISNQNESKAKIRSGSQNSNLEESRQKVIKSTSYSEKLIALFRAAFRQKLKEFRNFGLIEFSAIRGKFYHQHSDIIAMLNVFKINN